MRRWFGLVLLAFALTVTVSRAEPVSGLTVSAYEVDRIPPTRTDLSYRLCGSPDYRNITQTWGGGSVAGCRADRVMVHYAGFIQIPEHDTLQFYLVSDDGGWLQVGNWEYGYWRDRGCWGSSSGSVDLSAGVYEFHDWYYENGGGACNVLYWSIDGGAWTVVPESAFIPASSPSTTSSTVLIPETTTTEEPSTTTSTSSTSTTSSPSTTFVTSSTVAETMPAPFTSAVSTTYATTTSDATTTTDVSTTVVQDTEPVSTTTVQETTTTEASAITATSAVTTSTGSKTIPPPITIAYTTTTEATTNTNPLRPVPTTSPVSPSISPVDASKAPTPTTTPPETPEAYTGGQAVEAASNPALLATATPEQAALIFGNLDENQLTPAQGAKIVKAVQNAPAKVREAFESNINIFGGVTDTYVPLGSKVPVSARRVIVASTLLVVAPVPKGKRK